MLVEYKNHIEASDFEVELIMQHRNMIANGRSGKIDVEYRDGKLIKFDPHPYFDRKKFLTFQEAR